MRAKAKVITPAGTTDEIEIKEAAKQGTVFAPKLCCASTGKINHIGEKTATVITPRVNIGALTFVDDMIGAGSALTVEKVMENSRKMENEKGAEISLEKSKWMILKKRRGEQGRDLKGVVNGGDIGRIDKYKALGNWIDEQGSLDIQLMEMEKKIPAYVQECTATSSQDKVGRMEIQAKMTIYEKVIKLSLLHNIEAWSNIRQVDFNKMEILQGRILKRIIGIPDSTPYWGLLYELDVWPVKMEVLYRKLMLYHGMMNSDPERTSRMIFEDQKKYEMKDCWIFEVLQESSEIGMVVNEKRANKMKKSERKKESKNRIQMEV